MSLMVLMIFLFMSYIIFFINFNLLSNYFNLNFGFFLWIYIMFFYILYFYLFYNSLMCSDIEVFDFLFLEFEEFMMII